LSSKLRVFFDVFEADYQEPPEDLFPVPP